MLSPVSSLPSRERDCPSPSSSEFPLARGGGNGVILASLIYLLVPRPYISRVAQERKWRQNSSVPRTSSMAVGDREQDEDIVRSSGLVPDIAPSSEDIAASIAAAHEAVQSVLELKREEINKQEFIVEQLKRGVDEHFPDGFLASINQVESVMKTALRDMRCRIELYKTDLPDHLATQIADIDKKINTLTKMERSLRPLIIEETRYRNPQRLPRDGKNA